ncbi:unnamed protein product [Amoebophrya sp. A120]|nr:unnamed protein product [Amoebophrya sp. A120]|eukprot:GSA120T00013525001.1
MCLEAGDAGAGPRSFLGGLFITSRPGGRGDHDVEHVESSSSSTTVISSPVLLSRAGGVGTGVNTTTSFIRPSRRPYDRCRSSCSSSSSSTPSSSRKSTTTTMSMRNRRITTTKEPRTATEAEQFLPVSTPTSSTKKLRGAGFNMFTCGTRSRKSRSSSCSSTIFTTRTLAAVLLEILFYSSRSCTLFSPVAARIVVDERAAASDRPIMIPLEDDKAEEPDHDDSSKVEAGKNINIDDVDPSSYVSAELYYSDYSDEQEVQHEGVVVSVEDAPGAPSDNHDLLDVNKLHYQLQGGMIKPAAKQQKQSTSSQQDQIKKVKTTDTASRPSSSSSSAIEIEKTARTTPTKNRKDLQFAENFAVEPSGEMVKIDKDAGMTPPGAEEAVVEKDVVDDDFYPELDFDQDTTMLQVATKELLTRVEERQHRAAAPPVAVPDPAAVATYRNDNDPQQQQQVPSALSNRQQLTARSQLADDVVDEQGPSTRQPAAPEQTGAAPGDSQEKVPAVAQEDDNSNLSLREWLFNTSTREKMGAVRRNLGFAPRAAPAEQENATSNAQPPAQQPARTTTGAPQSRIAPEQDSAMQSATAGDVNNYGGSVQATPARPADQALVPAPEQTQTTAGRAPALLTPGGAPPPALGGEKDQKPTTSQRVDDEDSADGEDDGGATCHGKRTNSSQEEEGRCRVWW